MRSTTQVAGDILVAAIAVPLAILAYGAISLIKAIEYMIPGGR